MARPGQGSGQPPVSFKTIPGRNRTQKWNTARTYDYSGGDWGGYDPYDDYGDYDDQPPPMPSQGQPPLPSQQPQPPYGAQGFPRPNRQQSFDEGDERRAFSGPSLPGGFPASRAASGSPARSAVSSTSGGRRPSNDYPRPMTGGRPRDFTNPEQVPPPLNMRSSPAPTAMPPPRTASLPIPDEPNVISKKEAGKESFPTPFIRPSDIYKRMDAERERERESSMESAGRPSMADLDAATRSPSQQRPLSMVQEGPGEGEAAPQNSGQVGVSGASPSLPAFESVGGFGSDMWGTPRSQQATPIATRAPAGSDPAADILGERTHDVPVSQIGQPGTLRSADPAADILAERTHDIPVRQIGQTSTQTNSDPAADILAERTHDVPVHEIGRQESRGYRSMVHQAFDTSTASRGAVSQISTGPPSTSVSDVSRSNTTSTSSISPIMSRVPSAATARINHQQQTGTEGIATIAEEPQSRVSSDSYRIQRKPSPARSSIGGAEPVVRPGYRRSLDPPSADNSPARTPVLGDANPGRRLSEGFTAEVGDGAAPQTTGRPRAGTDYSVREADLAEDVRRSPVVDEESQPGLAESQKEAQDEYLKNHDNNAIAGAAVGLGVASAAAVAGAGYAATRTEDGLESGRSSPTKSRVRQLADQYQDLHDSSRRNSQVSTKSSWSNFRGSDENLPGRLPQRQATDASNVVSESDYGGLSEGGMRDSPADQSDAEVERPALGGREESFRPHLPGEWVSTSNVLSTLGDSNRPASGTQRDTNQEVEPQPQPTPRASQQLAPAEDEGPVDLTPTTRKVALDGTHQDTVLSQAKNAGAALGAALLSTVGLGHQTRDFGSTEPPQEVEVPNERNPTGEVGGFREPERPWLSRNETDASVASTVTAASFDSQATPAETREEAEVPSASSEASGAFFGAAAVLPLRTRETSPEVPSQQQPSALRSFFGRDDGLHRDDSTLRREIVRSLDGSSAQGQADDTALTQDALDAPGNAARIDRGQSALPANEISDNSPSKPQPLRPLMLDQRFSWENRGESQGALATPKKEEFASPSINTAVPRVQEPEESPEIKPEAPYERPRIRKLHVMNAEDSDDEDVSNGLTPDAVAGAAAGLGALGVVAGLAAVTTHSTTDVQSAASPPKDESRDADTDYLMRDSGDLQVLHPQEMQDQAAPEVYTPDESAGSGQASASTPLADTLTSGPPPPPEKDISPTSPTASQKPTPFREILALKTPAARIQAYDTTRQTFADMNTGLSDWLSTMLANNPEYVNLSTEALAPGIQSSSTFRPGHKHSPSLAKFTSRIGSGNDVQRSNTVSAGASSGAGGDGGGVDMEKLQQRGKDLMKNAGVLGVKVGGGAKGLLAKGRSRFGTQRESKGGKAPPPPSSLPTQVSSVSSPVIEVHQPPFSFPTIVAAPSPSPSPAPPSLPDASTDDAASTRAIPPPSREPTPSSLKPLHSRSQTLSLSSSSASRPLSRTFSRLRERSRSLSRSLSRSGRSRPDSLVLAHSNHGTDRSNTPANAAIDTGMDLQAFQDSLQGLAHWPVGRGEQDGGGAERVVSPWDEHEGLDFTELEALRSVTPGRLGVLPSPTAESFEGFRQGSVVESRGRGGSVGVEAPEENNEERRLGMERVGSDLAGLPSQRREVKMAAQTPADSADGFGDQKVDDDEDDDLYLTTPTSDRFHKVDRNVPDDARLEDTTGAAPLPEEGAEQRQVVAGASEDGGVRSGVDKALPALPVKSDAASEHTTPRTSRVDGKHNRSIVSANHDFEDATDSPPALAGETIPTRNSSVSSLHHEEPVMSAQAVPAGPIGFNAMQPLANEIAIDQQPRDTATHLAPGPMFTNLQYNSEHRQTISRPLSYLELGTDQAGAPLQETLSTPQKASQSADVGNLIDPSPTAVPMQWQPATQGSPTADARPKRWSGVVKGRRPTLTSPVIAPPPSQITDQFGLEGMHHDTTVVTPGEEAPYREPEVIGLQERRRSSFFGGRQRTSSRPGVEGAVDPSTDRMLPQPNSPLGPSSRISNKVDLDHRRAVSGSIPQRALTSAAATEPKKKRFSSLGSLFGRSSTTAGKPDKPRKLMKAQPSMDSPSQRAKPAPAGINDMVEAKQQRQIQERQPTLPAVYKEDHYVPQSGGAMGQRSQDADTWRGPPPQGWYAPGGDDNYQFNMQNQQQQQPPPQFRQLHSQRQRQSSAPVTWQQPSAGEDWQMPLADTPKHSLPQGQHYNYSQRPPYTHRSSSASYTRRHSSYASTENALSPQVSGQAEWEQSRWQPRGSSPMVSPIQQTRSGSDGFPSGRNYHVGSTRQRYYGGQSSGTADEHQAAPRIVGYGRGPGQTAQASLGASDPYRAMPEQPYHDPTYAEPGMRWYGSVHPSNPQDPSTRDYNDLYSGRVEDLQYPDHQDYNEQWATRRPSAPPIPPHKTALSDSYGRRQSSSSFLGRRDDPVVSEDALDMRGASYPGQEWVPQRWD